MSRRGKGAKTKPRPRATVQAGTVTALASEIVELEAVVVFRQTRIELREVETTLAYIK